VGVSEIQDYMKLLPNVRQSPQTRSGCTWALRAPRPSLRASSRDQSGSKLPALQSAPVALKSCFFNERFAYFPRQRSGRTGPLAWAGL